VARVEPGPPVVMDIRALLRIRTLPARSVGVEVASIGGTPSTASVAHGGARLSCPTVGMDHRTLHGGPDEQVPPKLRPQPANLIRIHALASLTAAMERRFPNRFFKFTDL